MQRWFVDFVKGGLGAVAGRVPVYGEGAQVVDVVDVEKGRFEVVRDPAANERCRYWLSLCGGGAGCWEVVVRSSPAGSGDEGCVL
jgi:hypothetical protein